MAVPVRHKGRGNLQFVEIIAWVSRVWPWNDAGCSAASGLMLACPMTEKSGNAR